MHASTGRSRSSPACPARGRFGSTLGRAAFLPAERSPASGAGRATGTCRNAIRRRRRASRRSPSTRRVATAGARGARSSGIPSTTFSNLSCSTLSRPEAGRRWCSATAPAAARPGRLDRDRAAGRPGDRRRGVRARASRRGSVGKPRRRDDAPRHRRRAMHAAPGPSRDPALDRADRRSRRGAPARAACLASRARTLSACTTRRPRHGSAGASSMRNA